MAVSGVLESHACSCSARGGRCGEQMWSGFGVEVINIYLL